MTGTNRVGTLVQSESFCQLPGWLPNRNWPCTLIGFVVTTGSALRPWAYF